MTPASSSSGDEDGDIPTTDDDQRWPKNDVCDFAEQKYKLIQELNKIIADKHESDRSEGPSLDDNGRWRLHIPIILANGAVYTGQLLQGAKDGQGTQVWPDGSRYVGQWKNDLANGYGTLTHPNGNTYEGSWLNDQAHGHGTFKSVNGASYIGEWRWNERDGVGIEKLPDGA